MATRQDEIKTGTVEGAADRLAAIREAGQREALETIGDKEDLPVEVEAEAPPEEIPVEQEAPPEEIAPQEDDLFADDLDEAPLETLDAPAALPTEAKELFAQADPELQKAISERLAAAERGATQKVQQAAAKEKEVAQIAEQVLQMKDEWSRKLESLDVSLPEPPDPDLADPNSDRYDPDGFNVQMAKYERAKINVEKQRTERQKLAEESANQTAAQTENRKAQDALRIIQHFPTWNTQEKFTEGVQGVHDFLVSEGIPRETVGQITDPDMIRISYMASRYKMAKSKAREGKPTTRNSAPSGRPRTQSTTNLTEKRKSLKETGSMDDAVAILSATRRK